MSAHRFVAAIDFDHTIHNPEDRAPGYKMGRPYPGAKEALTRLADAGARIIIHTCRARTPQGVEDGPWIGTADHVASWLDYFDIPYDEITALKPVADVYVDDRAVPFQGNWEATGMELLTLCFLGERL